MVGKLNIEEQELLADTFARAEADFTLRERLIELPVAVGFFAAVVVVWAAWPPHGFEALPCVLCLAVMAFASVVRFDTPFGFTLATQLAFVPLLFAMPVAVVPIAVLLALLLAGAFEVWRGNLRPLRLLLTPGNSWFAIGPVAVFAVAHTEPRHAGWTLLVIALAAQFAVDFSISTLRFAEARGAGLAEQLRESWVYLIDIALTGMALVVAEQVHEHPFVALAPLPLLGLLAWFAGERRERLVNLLELNSAYRGTALVLGDVVEADDGYTGVHCRGVLGLALAVADELGLGAEQRRNLEFGALLHDVGKIAIPKEIVNKPGKLDPEEWQIIKTHTVEGQNMLDRIGGFMRDVGLIVRSHHERWDGGGYPDGLKGEEIPLEARIVTCCDSWNAMRTDRAYRKALPPEVALAELNANSGRQFDPRIVEVVTAIVGEAAELAETATGQASIRQPSPSLVAG
ncbi:MAG TPA: HD-GYP domain-containing protein [Solirubrobacteraceae bacterium]|nr:HD-GYP domain-containing protein [Solirubrobacteraceae bacterium]HUH81570.1 HD-GYP domain-containing protein [Solirubrobacteraceae bacterium]